VTSEQAEAQIRKLGGGMTQKKGGDMVPRCMKISNAKRALSITCSYRISN
jgi:hypothetical protein